MSFTSGQILTASQLNTFAPGTRITNADGSSSAPAYSFSTDDNTGFYVTGNEGRIRFVGDGTPGGWLSNTGIRTVDGSASVPSFSFTSDSNTGMFRSGTDELGFSTAGSQRLTIQSDGDVGVGYTSPDARLHVNSGDTNLGVLVESTDAGAIIGLKDNSTSGTSHVGIKATGDALVLRSNNSDFVTISTDGSIRATDGSASAPTYVFDSDTNTGFFVTGNNGRIHFSGNGVEGGDLLSTGGRFIDGSATTPSYAFKDDTNTGMFRTGSDEIGFACGGNEIFQVLTNGVFVSTSGDNYFATAPTTGTGNDAEWSSTGLGSFVLKRNSSLTAEKENITADLGTHLTADMIDSVVPKMWNRINSPGYPEIGPLAEDMDAISPFLAVKGANVQSGEYEEFLTGINKTAYLSLLVLAVKDLRTRVAALESA